MGHVKNRSKPSIFLVYLFAIMSMIYGQPTYAAPATCGRTSDDIRGPCHVCGRTSDDIRGPRSSIRAPGHICGPGHLCGGANDLCSPGSSICGANDLCSSTTVCTTRARVL